MAFSLFPAYFDKPANISFATQEQGEEIELLLRQHWVTNVPWILVTIISLFLPPLLLSINSITGLSFRSQVPHNILLGIIIIWYLFVLAYIIQNFFYWYFNIYIITTKKLLDITMQNLLNIYSTAIRLDDVQSSRYQFYGLLGSLFDFGDVMIETAAEGQDINFVAVPKPDLVRDRIEDLQNKQEKGPGGVD